MKKMYFLSITLLFCANVLLAQAQITRLFSYQGMLSDSSGVPKPDGTYSFKFSLYTTSLGGNAIWTETKTLPVNKGMFSTKLGDQVLIPDSLKFDTGYWLGVKVGLSTELMPRTMLTAVPYSIYSLRTDSAKFAFNTPPISRPFNPLISSAEIQNYAIQKNHLSVGLKVSYADTADFVRNINMPSIGTIVTLGNDNYQYITITNGSLVNVKEVVNITAPYSTLGQQRLLIQGGGFSGTSGEELRIGNSSTLCGVTFKNLKISGGNLEFIGCTFEGNMTFLNDCYYENCTFTSLNTNSIIGTISNSVLESCNITYRLGVIKSSKLSNCTFNKIDEAHGCTWTNTTVSGYIGIANTNSVSSCSITLTGDCVFSQNVMSLSTLEIAPTTNSAIISGNIFGGMYPGKSGIVTIDCGGSYGRSINLSGNDFNLQPTDPQAVLITNNPTGYFVIIKISENSFMNGARAISYSSNAKTIVSDNATLAVPLGVNTGSTITVINNISF